MIVFFCRRFLQNSSDCIVFKLHCGIKWRCDLLWCKIIVNVCDFVEKGNIFALDIELNVDYEIP